VVAAKFRCGVGMCVLDEGGRVLAFERSGIAGAFQLPQGGIGEGEEPLDAMWRELREETGLDPAHVVILGVVPEWLGYELPPEARSKRVGRGQVHKWFILRARSAELPIVVGADAHAEFRSWRWSDLRQLASHVAPFRQPVYQRLVEFVERY
jgi:putative (di)nucleoside polyphosphate hydrolase